MAERDDARTVSAGPRELCVPSASLVLLVGTSGCGKSTFARRHFRPHEVVASDACRLMVANDEADQSATRDAFDVLHLIVDRRMQRGLLTVVDATNLQREARRPLLDLALRARLPSVAIVFDLPAELCAERNRARSTRTVDDAVLRMQRGRLDRTLEELPGEGLHAIHVLRTEREVRDATVRRIARLGSPSDTPASLPE